ncbi:MAG: RimK/LysX family protein [Cyclobacteriaceae bacterium]|nr:ATP-dependent zinc protease [Cyclobacteriaceae bacterium]MCH8515888.1 RimK/LysX family protein [Cyclobacteriaceae bacterium]
MALDKIIIGRRDVIGIKELGINQLKAKVDTGAYSCSIHCESYHLDENELLHYTIKDPVTEQLVSMQTDNYEMKRIKSSTGKSQKRYLVKLTIQIFDKEYRTFFSLSDRSKMRNPVLIGRRMLADRFVVDVSRKNLSAKGLKLMV